MQTSSHDVSHSQSWLGQGKQLLFLVFCDLLWYPSVICGVINESGADDRQCVQIVSEVVEF